MFPLTPENKTALTILKSGTAGSFVNKKGEFILPKHLEDRISEFDYFSLFDDALAQPVIGQVYFGKSVEKPYASIFSVNE